MNHIQWLVFRPAASSARTRLKTLSWASRKRCRPNGSLIAVRRPPDGTVSGVCETPSRTGRSCRPSGLVGDLIARVVGPA